MTFSSKEAARIKELDFIIDLYNISIDSTWHVFSSCVFKLMSTTTTVVFTSALLLCCTKWEINKNSFGMQNRSCTPSIKLFNKRFKLRWRLQCVLKSYKVVMIVDMETLEGTERTAQPCWLTWVNTCWREYDARLFIFDWCKFDRQNINHNHQHIFGEKLNGIGSMTAQMKCHNVNWFEWKYDVVNFNQKQRAFPLFISVLWQNRLFNMNSSVCCFD